MKKILMGATALALVSAPAFAAGIERSSQSVDILFEKGRYLEFTWAGVNPSIDGAITHPLAGVISSGDMANGYNNISFGYKADINEQLSYAVILDQPFGARVNYAHTAPGYPLAGTSARVVSNALTALVKYTMPNNVSVYGGLRAISSEGSVNLPAQGYSMKTSRETDLGYVLGVAWEKPEIAARVSLTYNSAITHKFAATENGNPSLPFETELPQSVNLEFQTGVAADTLVFGSVRWVDWKSFEIRPKGYEMATGGQPLVSYDHNSTAYTLGVGRKFNDSWSGALSIGYEDGGPGYSSNLGPTDGQASIGLAAIYTQDNMKITTGIRYVKNLNADTQIGPLTGKFRDNSTVAAGISIGYQF